MRSTWSTALKGGQANDSNDNSGDDDSAGDDDGDDNSDAGDAQEQEGERTKKAFKDEIFLNKKVSGESLGPSSNGESLDNNGSEMSRNFLPLSLSLSLSLTHTHTHTHTHTITHAHVHTHTRTFFGRFFFLR